MNSNLIRERAAALQQKTSSEPKGSLFSIQKVSDPDLFRAVQAKNAAIMKQQQAPQTQPLRTGMGFTTSAARRAVMANQSKPQPLGKATVTRQWPPQKEGEPSSAPSRIKSGADESIAKTVLDFMNGGSTVSPNNAQPSSPNAQKPLSPFELFGSRVKNHHHHQQQEGKLAGASENAMPRRTSSEGNVLDRLPQHLRHHLANIGQSPDLLRPKPPRRSQTTTMLLESARAVDFSFDDVAPRAGYQPTLVKASDKHRIQVVKQARRGRTAPKKRQRYCERVGSRSATPDPSKSRFATMGSLSSPDLLRAREKAAKAQTLTPHSLAKATTVLPQPSLVPMNDVACHGEDAAEDGDTSPVNSVIMRQKIANMTAMSFKREIQSNRTSISSEDVMAEIRDKTIEAGEIYDEDVDGAYMSIEEREKTLRRRMNKIPTLPASLSPEVLLDVDVGKAREELKPIRNHQRFGWKLPAHESTSTDSLHQREKSLSVASSSSSFDNAASPSQLDQMRMAKKKKKPVPKPRKQSRSSISNEGNPFTCAATASTPCVANGNDANRASKKKPVPAPRRKGSTGRPLYDPESLQAPALPVAKKRSMSMPLFVNLPLPPPTPPTQPVEASSSTAANHRPSFYTNAALPSYSAGMKAQNMELRKSFRGNGQNDPFSPLQQQQQQALGHHGEQMLALRPKDGRIPKSSRTANSMPVGTAQQFLSLPRAIGMEADKHSETSFAEFCEEFTEEVHADDEQTLLADNEDSDAGNGGILARSRSLFRSKKKPPKTQEEKDDKKAKKERDRRRKQILRDNLRVQKERRRQEKAEKKRLAKEKKIKAKEEKRRVKEEKKEMKRLKKLLKKQRRRSQTLPTLDESEPLDHTLSLAQLEKKAKRRQSKENLTVDVSVNVDADGVPPASKDDAKQKKKSLRKERSASKGSLFGFGRKRRSSHGLLRESEEELQDEDQGHVYDKGRVVSDTPLQQVGDSSAQRHGDDEEISDFSSTHGVGTLHHSQSNPMLLPPAVVPPRRSTSSSMISVGMSQTRISLNGVSKTLSSMTCIPTLTAQHLTEGQQNQAQHAAPSILKMSKSSRESLDREKEFIRRMSEQNLDTVPSNRPSVMGSRKASERSLNALKKEEKGENRSGDQQLQHGLGAPSNDAHFDSAVAERRRSSHSAQEQRQERAAQRRRVSTQSLESVPEMPEAKRLPSNPVSAPDAVHTVPSHDCRNVKHGAESAEAKGDPAQEGELSELKAALARRNTITKRLHRSAASQKIQTLKTGRTGNAHVATSIRRASMSRARMSISIRNSRASQANFASTMAMATATSTAVSTSTHHSGMLHAHTTVSARKDMLARTTAVTTAIPEQSGDLYRRELTGPIVPQTTPSNRSSGIALSTASSPPQVKKDAPTAALFHDDANGAMSELEQKLLRARRRSEQALVSST